MKVIEKDLLVSGNKCGTFCAYEEVEPELEITADTPPLTRVLPAPYFYEKRLFFHLIRRVEPGTKVGFTNGGYEVRDEGGALRSFDLDQVIIHPQIIKHQKTLDKMARKAEKEAKKRLLEKKRAERAANPKRKTGKRGRPALDPAVKAAREAERVSRSARSGGKRGRPKSLTPAPTRVQKTTSGKRGRPSLTPEALAAKASAKAAVRARSGGKRGRPKRK